MKLPVICAALALSSVGCGHRAPRRLGIVLDADGVHGAELAAADINAAGGVGGRRLQLRVLGSTAASTLARIALAGADSLVSDPTILAVVGHTNSNASLAAAQVYNEHHVVQIAPTTTTPLYSNAGPYSFRMVASDVHQGGFLARVIGADSAPRVAVLYVNDDYGRSLYRAFVDSLSQDHLLPVYQSPYGEGSAFTDASDLARAIARTNPNRLVWIGRSPELKRFLPLLRERVPSIAVLASDGFAGVPSETGSVREFVGVEYVRLLDLQQPSQRVREIRERFERTWHQPPTDQGMLAYEAVMMLAQAMDSAGPNREAIRIYLAEIGHRHPAFQGMYGPIVFDANGDPSPSYYLAVVTPNGSQPVNMTGPKRGTP